jgi:uncharacterized protein
MPSPKDRGSYEVPADLVSDFEWDPAKAGANRQKHRTDFWVAVRIWQGDVLERPDTRRVYGEERIQAFGQVEGRTIAVIFTWREGRRRIISARKANLREQRFFIESIRRRR